MRELSYLSIILAFLAIVLGVLSIRVDAMVDKEEALQEISIMVGEEVELLRQSNSSMFWGDPWRVQYVVSYNQNDTTVIRQTFTCESALFSPMICRDY